jgi:multidrug efflux system outer membrane protein
MRRRRAWLAAVLPLAGCAVGPNYHRPDTQTPAAYRGDAAPAAASLADDKWWELYSDPVLTDLVRKALANGFDARIAAVRVEQSRAISLEANGLYYPSLAYSSEAFRGKNSLLGNPNPAGNGSIGDGFAPYLSAAWELDVWGRVRRLDEAARSQYLGTQAAERGVRLSLLSEVAEDYFSLLEADQELVIARQATHDFGSSFSLFTERLQGGVASRLETSSAAAAQAAAAAQIPALERRVAMTENEISVLLGENPEPVARGAPLADHAAAPSTPPGLPSALLERRPDILQAEYAAKQANAEIGVTIGSFLPRFGLSAVLGAATQNWSKLTHQRSELWAGGVDLTGPLVQGGALRGEYLQAKAAWQLAKLQYEQTVVGAYADVANALITRQKLAESRVQLAKEVDAYRDAVRVAGERYRAGQAGYYELLQVQQQLYPAEVALAQAQRDELISVVQLYKALGGGWNEPL